MSDDAARCSAHGEERCPECSRIDQYDLEGKRCRGCDAWGDTGMHWGTCPHRLRGPIVTSMAEDCDQVSTAISIEPVKSVLTYAFTGGEWAVNPRELATLFEHIGDLVDAGMPGAKVRNVVFDRNEIRVEVR